MQEYEVLGEYLYGMRRVRMLDGSGYAYQKRGENLTDGEILPYRFELNFDFSRGFGRGILRGGDLLYISCNGGSSRCPYSMVATTINSDCSLRLVTISSGKTYLDTNKQDLIDIDFIDAKPFNGKIAATRKSIFEGWKLMRDDLSYLPYEFATSPKFYSGEPEIVKMYNREKYMFIDTDLGICDDSILAEEEAKLKLKDARRRIREEEKARLARKAEEEQS